MRTGAFGRAFNDDNPFHKPQYQDLAPIGNSDVDFHVGILRNSIVGTEADFGTGAPEITFAQGHYEYVGGGVEAIDGRIGPFFTFGPAVELNTCLAAESVLKFSVVGGNSWETSVTAGVPDFYGLKFLMSVKNVVIYPQNLAPASNAVMQNIQEATVPRFDTVDGQRTALPDWLKKLTGG